MINVTPVVITAPTQPVTGAASSPSTTKPSSPTSAPADREVWKFTIKVPVKIKSVKFWSGRIEAKVDLLLTVDVELLGGQEKQEEAQKAVEAKTLDWQTVSLEKTFTSGAFFSDGTFTHTMTELSLGFSSHTAIGQFDWKLTIAGFDTKITELRASVKVMSGGITWAPVDIHLGPQTIGPLQFKDIILKPGGKITVAPNYTEIVKQWAIEKAEEEGIGVFEKKAGEVIATVVSFDAAIAAALGAVAIGTVLGVTAMFVNKIHSDQILAACASAIRDLNGGVRAGLAGEAGGGSDMFQAGWSIGHEAHEKAVAELNAELAKPGAEVVLPDEFTQRVKDAAGKAVHSWGKWGQIDGQIRDQFWHRWADQNHGIGTTLGDAKVLVAQIYGKDEDERGPHMLYWSKISFFNNKPGFWSI